jgi:hypothetical protein
MESECLTSVGSSRRRTAVAADSTPTVLTRKRTQRRGGRGELGTHSGNGRRCGQQKEEEGRRGIEGKRGSKKKGGCWLNEESEILRAWPNAIWQQQQQEWQQKQARTSLKGGANARNNCGPMMSACLSDANQITHSASARRN